MIKMTMKLTPKAQKALSVDVVKDSRVRFTFRDGLNMIADYARDNHRYKTRTGKLEQSTEAQLLNDNPLVGSIGAGGGLAPYGIFVHEGTGRHYIKPVNKRVLRFVSGNNFIFSNGHYVNGIKPDPFLKQAIDVKLPEFETELSKVIESVLEGD